MTFYTAEFARYFDVAAVKWIHEFSPRLIAFAEEQVPVGRLLDLCCGGGITAEVFARKGWQVRGVDRSSHMLDVARRRLGSAGLESQVDFVEADARTYRAGDEMQADMVTCLDGALNHIERRSELVDCLRTAAAALRPGGILVFDLFSNHHLQHWDNMSLVENPGYCVAKRGVWNTDGGYGLLRVSGVFTDDDGNHRVDQVLASWYYDDEVVDAAVREAGLAPAATSFELEFVNCDSGSCSRTAEPCRTIYSAVKVEH